MILGTNATVEYGVQVVHSNGTVVEPAGRDITHSKEVLCITLSQVVHLAPQQTKVVRATVQGPGSDSETPVVGVVTPTEDILAKQQCDIEETL